LLRIEEDEIEGLELLDEKEAFNAEEVLVSEDIWVSIKMFGCLNVYVGK